MSTILRSAISNIKYLCCCGNTSDRKAAKATKDHPEHQSLFPSTTNNEEPNKERLLDDPQPGASPSFHSDTTEQPTSFSDLQNTSDRKGAKATEDHPEHQSLFPSTTNNEEPKKERLLDDPQPGASPSFHSDATGQPTSFSNLYENPNSNDNINGSNPGLDASYYFPNLNQNPNTGEATANQQFQQHPQPFTDQRIKSEYAKYFSDKVSDGPQLTQEQQTFEKLEYALTTSAAKFVKELVTKLIAYIVTLYKEKPEVVKKAEGPINDVISQINEELTSDPHFSNPLTKKEVLDVAKPAKLGQLQSLLQQSQTINTSPTSNTSKTTSTEPELQKAKIKEKIISEINRSSNDEEIKNTIIRPTLTAIIVYIENVKNQNPDANKLFKSAYDSLIIHIAKAMISQGGSSAMGSYSGSPLLDVDYMLLLAENVDPNDQFFRETGYKVSPELQTLMRQMLSSKNALLDESAKNNNLIKAFAEFCNKTHTRDAAKEPQEQPQLPDVKSLKLKERGVIDKHSDLIDEAQKVLGEFILQQLTRENSSITPEYFDKLKEILLSAQSQLSLNRDQACNTLAADKGKMLDKQAYIEKLTTLFSNYFPTASLDQVRKDELTIVIKELLKRIDRYKVMYTDNGNRIASLIINRLTSHINAANYEDKIKVIDQTLALFEPEAQAETEEIDPQVLELHKKLSSVPQLKESYQYQRQKNSNFKECVLGLIRAEITKKKPGIDLKTQE